MMNRVGFITCWIFSVLSVILMHTEAQEQLINVASFTERIDELARDALGRDHIQVGTFSTEGLIGGVLDRQFDHQQ